MNLSERNLPFFNEKNLFANVVKYFTLANDSNAHRFLFVLMETGFKIASSALKTKNGNNNYATLEIILNYCLIT